MHSGAKKCVKEYRKISVWHLVELSRAHKEFESHEHFFTIKCEEPIMGRVHFDEITTMNDYLINLVYESEEA